MPPAHRSTAGRRWTMNCSSASRLTASSLFPAPRLACSHGPRQRRDTRRPVGGLARERTASRSLGAASDLTIPVRRLRVCGSVGGSRRGASPYLPAPPPAPVYTGCSMRRPPLLPCRCRGAAVAGDAGGRTCALRGGRQQQRAQQQRRGHARRGAAPCTQLLQENGQRRAGGAAAGAAAPACGVGGSGAAAHHRGCQGAAALVPRPAPALLPGRGRAGRQRACQGGRCIRGRKGWCGSGQLACTWDAGTHGP